MKQVNIMIGRFQPFTNGHLKCVEEAWKKLHIPTVVCMINTKYEKVDEKHPFPSSLTLPLYQEAFKGDKMIEDIVLVVNADIVKIGEILKDKGYEIKSWTCGTDRIDSYTKMADKYHDQAGLADDFEMIEIKRGDEDISATKVRKALMDDDKVTFDKLTPFGSLKIHLKNKNVYNILKEQLNKVIK